MNETIITHPSNIHIIDKQKIEMRHNAVMQQSAGHSRATKQTKAILRSSNMRYELHKIVMKQINAGRIQQATAKHDIGGGMQHREIRTTAVAQQTMDAQTPAQHIVVISGILVYDVVILFKLFALDPVEKVSSR